LGKVVSFCEPWCSSSPFHSAVIGERYHAFFQIILFFRSQPCAVILRDTLISKKVISLIPVSTTVTSFRRAGNCLITDRKGFAKVLANLAYFPLINRYLSLLGNQPG